MEEYKYRHYFSTHLVLHSNTPYDSVEQRLQLENEARNLMALSLQSGVGLVQWDETELVEGMEDAPDE